MATSLRQPPLDFQVRNLFNAEPEQAVDPSSIGQLRNRNLDESFSKVKSQPAQATAAPVPGI